MTSQTITSKKKRKRSKDNSPTESKLPTKLLQSLEKSDRKASKLRLTELSTDTVPKSRAAQSALDVQTHLMECRILLQKALTSLPSLASQCGSDSNNGGGEEKERAVVKKAADRLLLHLLEARQTLYPNLTNNDTDDDDSNDDEEKSKQKQHYSKLIQQTSTNTNSTTIETKLHEEYETLQPIWKSTLNQRHADLRLSSGGGGGRRRGGDNASSSDSNRFKVVDTSFWSQVEGTVRHDAVLHPLPLRIPPSVLQDTHNNNNNNNNNSHNNDGDEEDASPILPPRPTTPTPPEPPSTQPLFDDSKLYRHLLQDFLTLSTERRRHGGEDGGAIGAAERLDKRRRKKERSNSKSNGVNGVVVDRKASKGRKIRYTVYPKLAHFTFPVERGSGGDDTGIMDEDVLFRSMFGGVGAGRRR